MENSSWTIVTQSHRTLADNFYASAIRVRPGQLSVSAVGLVVVIDHIMVYQKGSKSKLHHGLPKTSKESMLSSCIVYNIVDADNCYVS